MESVSCSIDYSGRLYPLPASKYSIAVASVAERGSSPLIPSALWGGGCVSRGGLGTMWQGGGNYGENVIIYYLFTAVMFSVRHSSHARNIQYYGACNMSG